MYIVAKGAAIQAHIIATKDAIEKQSKLVAKCVLIDATSHSLGIEDNDGNMSVIIEKNKSVPYSARRTYTNPYDDMSAISLPVYEGEMKIAKKNDYWIHFVWRGWPNCQQKKQNTWSLLQLI